MRVCYDYKQKYIPTGIRLNSTQWKNGKIVNCPDMPQISQILDTLLTDVRQILLDMLTEGSINMSAIQERLSKKRKGIISFMDYCESRANIRKYGIRQDSQKRYNRFLRLFKAWGKIKEFEDIDDRSIIEYDNYLNSKGLKPYSKWNNYHRFLNSFIMDAIDEGYIRRNPYKWITINKDKKTHGIERCLTPEEFHRLKNAKMPTKSIERVRDLFVFQTYTCLSYSDLREFDSKNIQKIKGANVYIGTRIKTNIPFTIPIPSPAINILNRYNGKLPLISNVKYNEYLKVVAQSAGIDKPVSTHWARHTGATLLLNEGVDMKIVSKICGHSSTRITEQVYAKLLDETVVDAMSDINI